ncbi:flagellar export chaperone FliS [Kushneria marisflavi]|uniref:Flagellar secretion chaperone FliS n=2 Tax=Kushneria marisflavi TaxID=157779 RepID=A0A240USD9_9GAMM|nr:flagellar export chaperone FliS [Kushneria marisflavi]ART64404.1 flagellar export chaperone FliS [Kushneria marisflavi]RKD76875.1 flagellar protein FliS [Kushneria marisflavi]
MYTQRGASTYASVGVETGAMSASPHQLIVMLFDGAMAAIFKAKWAMDHHDIAGRGMAISKAIDIIDGGLRASLDMTRGGELAGRLSSLYEYMSRSLLKANVSNDKALLEHVESLLSDISGAWKEIGTASQQPAAAAQG